MKLWYNGEKKESGFSPCVKKEKHSFNNKLISSQIKRKSMSILSCGCALSLFFCVLPLDCISVSAAEPGQDAANEMLYGYVNSIPEYIDKVDDDIQAMTIIGSTLGAKYAGYYATIRLMEEIISSDEWDINVSDGNISPDVVSGFYKLPDSDNIYIGTLYSVTGLNEPFFIGSSGVSYNITVETGKNPDDYYVETFDSNDYYYLYRIFRDDSNPSGALALVPTNPAYYAYYFGYTSRYPVEVYVKYHYSVTIPTWNYYNNLYNLGAYRTVSMANVSIGGCGSWFVPPDNSPDWQAIREMTKPQKEEYFKRYIPDVFNVYYKSVHPELEPYFIHFEPDEETPTYPNPPVNPDGSCCCCNHDIIINNNINNDWVYETQNLPDSPSIDLQIPTADFELLNPSEELETHGNAIALWFDVFNHLIDSFELQGFILMMCGLALAAFIVWRLG